MRLKSPAYEDLTADRTVTTDDICATRPIVIAQAGVDNNSDSSHEIGRGGSSTSRRSEIVGVVRRHDQLQRRSMLVLRASPSQSANCLPDARRRCTDAHGAEQTGKRAEWRTLGRATIVANPPLGIDLALLRHGLALLLIEDSQLGQRIAVASNGHQFRSSWSDRVNRHIAHMGPTGRVPSSGDSTSAGPPYGLAPPGKRGRVNVQGVRFECPPHSGAG